MNRNRRKKHKTFLTLFCGNYHLFLNCHKNKRTAISIHKCNQNKPFKVTKNDNRTTEKKNDNQLGIIKKDNGSSQDYINAILKNKSVPRVCLSLYSISITAGIIFFFAEECTSVECEYYRSHGWRGFTWYVKLRGKKEKVAALPILPKGVGQKVLNTTDRVSTMEITEFNFIFRWCLTTPFVGVKNSEKLS